jgi:Ca2+-binding EF-hand superfamily protein
MNEMDADKDGFISYQEFLIVSTSKQQAFQDQNLRMAFEKFDSNGDNLLSKEELKQILNTNNEYLDQIIKKIDLDGDGFVSYSEFLSLMKGIVNKTNDPIVHSKIIRSNINIDMEEHVNKETLKGYKSSSESEY